ncbi:hypothetical protein Sp245p_31175 (plasmid) [Azospirillum baldaniorum]|uniref:Cyclic nucleotide-binding domain-containing protein n=1 Tax=Azospirillum baldaniorum TaxID=1064539 RepID=A0A9P1K1Q0_9PROT|nr:hypothetical protein [Azospirillum baldaniorum]AWJ94330.1 hypothetical protein Sp245p_31175 [Azospirillum baldaniorum]TWA67810.1 N12 class adenine-specific DNA methylase [Azospirillum brasilense]CCD03901.1 protein of unknown function [Azospirillum baldaniorum]
MSDVSMTVSGDSEDTTFALRRPPHRTPAEDYALSMTSESSAWARCEDARRAVWRRAKRGRGKAVEAALAVLAEGGLPKARRRAQRVLARAGVPHDAVAAFDDAAHLYRAASVEATHAVARLGDLGVRVPGEAARDIAAFRRQLLQAARRLNPTIGVTAVQELWGEGAALVASGAASDGRIRVAGMFERAKGLASISMDVARFDPLDTVYHEGWHSLEALLSEKDQQVLAEEFPGTEQLSHRERVAYAFGAWAARRDRSGPRAQRVFERVGRFCGRLANWLDSRGFQTAEDLFERAYEGDYGRRAAKLARRDPKALRTQRPLIGDATDPRQYSLGAAPWQPPDRFGSDDPRWRAAEARLAAAAADGDRLVAAAALDAARRQAADPLCRDTLVHMAPSALLALTADPRPGLDHPPPDLERLRGEIADGGAEALPELTLRMPDAEARAQGFSAAPGRFSRPGDAPAGTAEVIGCRAIGIVHLAHEMGIERVPVRLHLRDDAVPWPLEPRWGIMPWRPAALAGMEHPGGRARVAMPDTPAWPAEMVVAQNPRTELVPSPPLRLRSRLQFSAGTGAEAVPSGGVLSDAPAAPRNHVIADPARLGTRSPKRRAADNIAAIETLLLVEADGRLPTDDERRLLAAYSGFGGVPQVFEPWRAVEQGWQPYADALQALLDPDEYAALRESVKNAHYTDGRVAAAMWDALAAAGVTASPDHPVRVLEPGCGPGWFIGLMPEALRDAAVTGIELDSVSGRIARLLYPGADIRLENFARTAIPDDWFDLAVGNVPFGKYHLFDARYADLKPTVHNHFLLKSVDLLRPGGVAALITSTFTLDAADTGVREALRDKAELVTAVRLPANWAGQSAGTEVAADLLVLRKRAEPLSSLRAAERDAVIAAEPDWIAVQSVRDPLGGPEMKVNRWFADHPDRVIGRLERSGTNYAGEHPDVTARLPRLKPSNVPERAAAELRDRLAALPTDLWKPMERSPVQAVETAPATAREGSYLLDSAGALRVVVDGALAVPAVGDRPFTAAEERLVRDGLAVRDALRRVFAAQREGRPQGERDAGRAALREAYEAFVAAHGAMRGRRAVRLLAADPDGPMLFALEQVAPDGAIHRADVFERDVLAAVTPPDRAATLDDALAIVLNETGTIDSARMAALLGTAPAEVEGRLVDTGLAFEDPATRRLVTRDDYLTGDVRSRLDVARLAAQTEERFARNVQALEAVQPDPIPFYQIAARLGAPWVAPAHIRRFAAELFQIPPEAVEVGYSPVDGRWEFRVTGGHRTAPGVTTTWATDRADGAELMLAALSGRPPVIKDKTKDGGPVINAEETLAARMKVREIQGAFRDWIWRDPERRAELAGVYNARFNRSVARVYDGGHLTFPTMAPEWAARARAIQKNGVWRALQGSTLLGWEAGAGKTFALVAACVEGKRMGLHRKPLLAVQATTLYGPDSVVETARAMYPAAKILAWPDKQTVTPEERRRFWGRVATGDWDLVVVPHDPFDMIPLSPALEERFLQEEKAAYREALQGLDPDESERTVKHMETRIAEIEARIEGLLKEGRRDDAVYFDDLGVDHIAVDEAHRYKNLYVPTSLGEIRGLPSQASQRAARMFARCRWLQDHGNRVLLGTGTPLSNSVAELYTLQRFLQYEDLARAGIEHFDAWAHTFADIDTTLEIDVVGRLRPVTRLAGYDNLLELRRLSDRVMDVVFVEDIPGVKRPRKLVQVVSAPPSQAQRDFIARLGTRAANLKSADPRDDNMLKIATEGRLAALDMRLVDPAGREFAQSKIHQAADNVARIARDNPGTTQLAFFDVGIHPTKTSGDFTLRQLFKDLLVEAGVPSEDIADFWEAEGRERERLKDALKRGTMRVGIGSSERLGTGVNVQDRLIAVHQLDCPWLPAHVNQRDRRAERQGNPLPEVHSLRYVTEGTFDAFGWQLQAAKDRFIREFLRGTLGLRSMRDEDPAELSPAHIMAIATGNPLLLKRAQLEAEIVQAEAARRAVERERDRFDREIARLGRTVTDLDARLPGARDAAETARGVLDGRLPVTVDGAEPADRRTLGEALTALLKAEADRQQAFRADVSVPPAGERTVGAAGPWPILLPADPELRHRQTPLMVLATPDGATDIRLNLRTPLGAAGSLEAALRGVVEKAEGLERMRAAAAAEIAQLRTVPLRSLGDASAIEAMKAELRKIEQILQLPDPDPRAPAACRGPCRGRRGGLWQLRRASDDRRRG